MSYCGGGIKPLKAAPARALRRPSATMAPRPAARSRGASKTISLAEHIGDHDASPLRPVPGDGPRAVSHKFVAGSRGHGLPTIFGPFIAGAHSVEIMEPYLEECHDVVVELVRYLSGHGVQRLTFVTKDGHPEGSERALRSFCDMAAGLGVEMKVNYIEGVHDRVARFLGQDGTWCVLSGRGLNVYQPARDAWERSCLHARRVRCSWLHAVHVPYRFSLVSEMRLDASAGTSAQDEWAQVHAAPRALRRRLRHIRRLQQLEGEGGQLNSRERALVRRKPTFMAALSRAGRPACGVSVEQPPRAALQWDSFEADMSEFKRKTMRELSSVIDYHIGCQDEQQPQVVKSFWKQQLVEDNLSIAVRRQCEEMRMGFVELNKELHNSRARGDGNVTAALRGLQSESSRRNSDMHAMRLKLAEASRTNERLEELSMETRELVQRCDRLLRRSLAGESSASLGSPDEATSRSLSLTRSYAALGVEFHVLDEGDGIVNDTPAAPSRAPVSSGQQRHLAFGIAASDGPHRRDPRRRGGGGVLERAQGVARSGADEAGAGCESVVPVRRPSLYKTLTSFDAGARQTTESEFQSEAHRAAAGA